ncbi:MAG: MFS transporter, partial [Pseudomonadota bacterium]
MKSANLPLVFILMTVMLDAMGIGLIIPVMPALLQDVGMADLTAAAKWAGPLLSAYALMQFIFSPLLGALSDKIGRRPVILGALVIMSLDYLLMAVAGSIWLILIARMIGGISAANQAVAGAYVADISAPEDKAARFG